MIYCYILLYMIVIYCYSYIMFKSIFKSIYISRKNYLDSLYKFNLDNKNKKLLKNKKEK
jgi:hypothetical protein